MRPFRRWFLPDTLVGRTVLVLLIGLLLSQVAGVILYSMSRLELANRLASDGAEHIAGVVKLFEATQEADRRRIIRAMERPGLRIFWDDHPLVSASDGDRSSLSVIQDELGKRLPNYETHVAVGGFLPLRPPQMDGHPEHGLPYGMEPLPDLHFEHPPLPPLSDDMEPPSEPGAGFGRHHPPMVRVAVHLPDGGWLNFIADVPFEETLWRPQFFGPLSGGLLVVMVLSVLAVRRAAKPLAVLAAAAQRLGRDVNATPVPLAGPREVRAAATAFNEMQTSLRRFVEDRTQMIAAISHDLRTPITRLKLRAEFVDDDEQRVKMLSDLDEMEAMISSTLAFARDDAARERRRPFDLALVLAELCAEFDADYQGPESLTVTAGLSGFKRTFANLLDNARKYGSDVDVTLSRDEGIVTVRIMDAGPGIPEAEMARVFAPFYRVESSRNRDTGGTGLGLAVARSVIRAHGGDITLANRPEGGLCVTVTVPA